MLLHFFGIDCDFMSKQGMNLIVLNKGLIAQLKEVISPVFDHYLEDT